MKQIIQKRLVKVAHFDIALDSHEYAKSVKNLDHVYSKFTEGTFKPARHLEDITNITGIARKYKFTDQLNQFTCEMICLMHLDSNEEYQQVIKAIYDELMELNPTMSRILDSYQWEDPTTHRIIEIMLKKAVIHGMTSELNVDDIVQYLENQFKEKVSYNQNVVELVYQLHGDYRIASSAVQWVVSRKTYNKIEKKLRAQCLKLTREPKKKRA